MASPKLQLDRYLDRESVFKTRLLRLEYFAGITCTMWAISAVFYTVLGVPVIALTSLLGCLMSVAVCIVIRNFPGTRPFVANLFLFATIVALCLCNASTDQQSPYVLVYFPIVTVLAAQIVGLRVAAVWSICLVVASMLSGSINLPDATIYFPTIHDRFFHSICAICTALWLSFEAEKFFNVQTEELRELSESLQEKTRLLELAEETARVGHWRWDFASDSVSLSTEARRICGLSLSESSIVPLSKFVNVWDIKQQELLQARLSKAKDLGLGFNESLSFQAGRETRHVSCKGLCERNLTHDVTGVFGTLRDDTQLRATTDRLSRKAEQLNKLASFDPLTGLTNRFQFQQQLRQVVENANISDRQMALLVLDMNGFKEINDSLGHQIGDEVLKVVASRLEEIVRSGDVVSRLGGDEFTIIVRDAKSEKEIESAARRIVDSIAAPMNIDDQELHVGISIGASMCPRDTKLPNELFTFADTAMYEAKAKKRGLAMYNADMTAELRQRRSAESQLAGALDRNEFRLVYQPQYELRTNRLSGFECLLRWKNGGRDVSPLKFIPLLEGNGKIISVGQWVLEQSLERIVEWQCLEQNLKLAINISPLQFRENSFADRVIDTISRYGVDPSTIELEITEGLLIQDLDNTADKLFKLKSRGLRISVDDFGTGYSSLSYLKHLPIDQLKIDRAFIKDIPDHDDGTIASSIIVLGQSLDMEVLAEGVESQAQLDFLTSQDCNSYQGNFANAAMESTDCKALLENANLSGPKSKIAL